MQRGLLGCVTGWDVDDVGRSDGIVVSVPGEIVIARYGELNKDLRDLGRVRCIDRAMDIVVLLRQGIVAEVG